MSKRTRVRRIFTSVTDYRELETMTADFLRRCLVIAIANLLISNYLGCSPAEIDFTTPCRDVVEAISRLHSSLPDHMPLEAKCKRYAVLLSMIHSEGVSEQVALLQLSVMSEKILNMLYEELRPTELASSYSNMIDTYRSSHLEPAFIDVVECSRQLFKRSRYDPISWLKYLYDQELDMIVTLYKRALGPPAKEIDLDSVDLSAFDPEFRKSLGRLFEKHSELIRQKHAHSSSEINVFNQLSSSYVSQLKQAREFIKMTESRLRQKELKRQRQKRYRERHAAEILEKSRLRRQQSREKALQVMGSRKEDTTQLQHWTEEMVDPVLERMEKVRQSNRERQKRYRERHSQYLRKRARDLQRLKRQKQKENAMLQLGPPERPKNASIPEAHQQQSHDNERATGQDEAGTSERVSSKHRVGDEQQGEKLIGLLAKSQRERHLARERQRRYRERNLELLRTKTREYARRRREQERLQREGADKQHDVGALLSESVVPKRRRTRQKRH